MSGGNGEGLTTDCAGDSMTVFVAVFPSHTSRDAPDIVRCLRECMARNLNGVKSVVESLRSLVLGCTGGTVELRGLFLDLG